MWATWANVCEYNKRHFLLYALFWTFVSFCYFLKFSFFLFRRGLNPPYRVKSVSMATFTDEDIQKLQANGNEENTKIWLGLYDKKVKFEPRLQEEVKQYLIQVFVIYLFLLKVH